MLNFLISLNDELYKGASQSQEAFACCVWLCQNTQLETVGAKQKPKSPGIGIRQASENFIGDPAPSSVMSKMPSALVLHIFHLRLDAKCLKDFLDSPVHTRLCLFGAWPM